MPLSSRCKSCVLESDIVNTLSYKNPHFRDELQLHNNTPNMCVFTCGAINTETKGKRIKSKLREDISSLLSTYQLKYVNWQWIWDTTCWWQIIQLCQIPIEWKLRLSRNMMLGWAHTGNQCPHVTPNKPDSSWLCSESQENRNYFIAECCALSHNLPNAVKK